MADKQKLPESKPKQLTREKVFRVEGTLIAQDTPVQPIQPIVLPPGAKADGGALRVLAFAYPTSDRQGPPGANYASLPGVQVTVTGDRRFSSAKTTDDTGEALWVGLSAGNYHVTVMNPSGYKTPEEYYVSVGGGQPVAQDVLDSLPNDVVPVRQDQETRVVIGFAPEPAVLKGYVYLASSSSQIPTGPAIENALIEFRQGDLLLARAKTGREGIFQQAINRPGFITVAPLPAVVDNRKLYPRPAEFLIKAEAGETAADLTISYVQGPGEIQVAARLARQVEGQEEITILPGATFKLWRGMNTSGKPFREIKTTGRAPAIFTDLDEGDYTIAVSGPVSYKGQAIELDQFGGDVMAVHLRGGQPLNLVDDRLSHFRFKPRATRVAVTVLDDESKRGLSGVSVSIIPEDEAGSPLRGVTGPSGEVIFNLPAGNYTTSLEQTKITMPDGSKWIPASSSPGEQSLKVAEDTPMLALEFRLTPERHIIFGYALGPDDKAIPFAEIEVQDAQGQTVTRVVADKFGKYEYRAELPGIYHLLPVQTAGGSPSRKFPVYVNENIQQNVPFGGGAPAPVIAPTVALNGNFKESVGDLTAYPLLTEDVGFPAMARLGAAGAPGAAPLGQIVEGALREVLSWRPKASDPKGFLAALNQAFALKEVQGHTEWTWTPRSYAVQLDLGAVTGAQASIYTRAKAALDQSLPLLEGLYPLLPEADPQKVEAVRAIVESSMNELVKELGVEGGPRVQRVDTLFGSLLGFDPLTDLRQFGPQVAIPDLVTGQLGLLRREFGFTGSQVNTVEEEQNLTNFYILVDHIFSLFLSWNTQRQFFDRVGSEVFLGTQLVLVSRTLAVVAESVQEAYFAMDSVFLGSAERQTIQLKFGNEPRLFVGELLAWIEYVASEEGPRLIRDGGKAGVIALHPTLERLHALAGDAMLDPSGKQKAADLPAGYRTSRVQRALQELAEHLREAAELTGQFTDNHNNQLKG